MSEEPRVILLVRSDLGMGKGKIAAQAGHAIQLLLLEQARIQEDTLILTLTPMLKAWLSGIYTKITLRVDSEEELEALCAEARKRDIPAVVVEDLGLTSFNGKRTKTVAAIGPVLKEVHDLFTKGLKMM